MTVYFSGAIQNFLQRFRPYGLRMGGIGEGRCGMGGSPMVRGGYFAVDKQEWLSCICAVYALGALFTGEPPVPLFPVG